ncbi:hypothetical protein JKG47_14120 [Acidithiobacillus sp. MC6.1]|jgi:hypothetical protein|nr:hypothetical protein [Acidithiobacillus sp. MC6.1]
MAKSDDILTAMITMRLREDAAAAYRGKTPAERREVMQQLRDKLDDILGVGNLFATPTTTTEKQALSEPHSPPSSTKRPPIPND